MNETFGEGDTAQENTTSSTVSFGTKSTEARAVILSLFDVQKHDVLSKIAKIFVVFM